MLPMEIDVRAARSKRKEGGTAIGSKKLVCQLTAAGKRWEISK